MRNALRTGFPKSAYRSSRVTIRRPRKAIAPLTYDDLLDSYEDRIIAFIYRPFFA